MIKNTDRAGPAQPDEMLSKSGNIFDDFIGIEQTVNVFSGWIGSNKVVSHHKTLLPQSNENRNRAGAAQPDEVLHLFFRKQTKCPHAFGNYITMQLVMTK